jgi:hypothetical protein
LAAKEPSASWKKDTLCSAKKRAKASRSASEQSDQRTMRDDENTGPSIVDVESVVLSGQVFSSLPAAAVSAKTDASVKLR